jgi:hypothetical protein
MDENPIPKEAFQITAGLSAHVDRHDVSWDIPL